MLIQNYKLCQKYKVRLIQLFTLHLEIKKTVEKLSKKDTEDEKDHKHQTNFFK